MFPRLLPVLLALLMPWRAAARIRGQHEDIVLLVRTLGSVAHEAAELRAALDPVPAYAAPPRRHLYAVRNGGLT
jgi:hypothetical protein